MNIFMYMTVILIVSTSMNIFEVSGTNMGPVFLFVFDRLNIDHYLTSNSSIDGKFHTLHRYIVEIGKKLNIAI